jgi:hypothetical protein
LPFDCSWQLLTHNVSVIEINPTLIWTFLTFYISCEFHTELHTQLECQPTVGEFYIGTPLL